MKTKKSVVSILLFTLMVASLSSAFADDDREGKYDDDRTNKYERYDNKYKDNDDDDRGGKYDNDGDDRYSNGSINQGKQARMSSSEKNKKVQVLKKAFAKKIGTRLDGFSQTKLETIIVIIDTKTLEIEADTTMSNEKKDRLQVAYAAIKELINEKIADLSTQGILDELLN